MTNLILVAGHRYCMPLDGISAAEYDIDPGEHQLELAPRQLPDALGEIRLVEHDNLRNVGDGLLGETRRARSKGHISGSGRPWLKARSYSTTVDGAGWIAVGC